ncbi:MAG: ABC transporter permease [Acidobacteria bacterium]|nr:ABC transporter permease [Acidobacteriota bacterium]
MLRYAIRRLLINIPVLLVLSFAGFFAAREIADPATSLRSNPRVRPEDLERYRESLGLDDGPLEQYWRWLTAFVTGDLGKSLIRNSQDVWSLIESALANTLVLVGVAITFSLLIGITTGIVAAMRQNTFVDYASTGFSFVFISMPTFWFALMVQLLFAVYLQDWIPGLNGPLLPSAGLYPPGQRTFDLFERGRHVALPALVLSVQLIAVYSRYMRASMLEVLGLDYVRTARSKGLSERRVVTRHAARNAMIPITTQAGTDLGLLIGGLIVTEQIFQYPGMGTLFLDALFAGDYPILLAWIMVTATAVVLANLAIDLIYGYLDPRIRVV